MQQTDIEDVPDARREGEQALAARAAIDGRLVPRLRIAVRAIRALLANPDDTAQVFLLGLSMNARQFPEFFTRFAIEQEGAELLRDQPSIDSSAVDYDALRALPSDTLGYAYARFLDEHGLDPDLFQAPPGLPALPAYVAKRVRQTHDLWHVLTGYGPDVAGEVALQAFTHAVTRMPSSRLIAVSAALRQARKEPRIIPMAIEGYRRGKRAAFLPAVRWERHFARPLADVRRELLAS